MPHKYVRIKNRKPQLKKLLKIFGYNGKFRCYWCGCKLSLKKVTIDHYIPISQEGLPFHIGNLVPACFECNNWRANNKEKFYLKMERIARNERRSLNKKYKRK